MRFIRFSLNSHRSFFFFALLPVGLAAELRQLTVKVLAQKRTESLSRLLSSLEAASYPETAKIDVEIHVDQVARSGGWLFGRSASADERKQRRAVIALARIWAGTRWDRGEARVFPSREQRGVRGMWLACSDPGLFGEEFTRVVILEDDIELSPAWRVAGAAHVWRVHRPPYPHPRRFEYLSAAHDAYTTSGDFAGISLQRQAARLDAYPRELAGSPMTSATAHGHANEKLAELEPDLPRDSVFLFPHVGSWGFSPEPKVWHAFLQWFASLGDAVDDETHWASFVERAPTASSTARRRTSTVVAGSVTSATSGLCVTRQQTATGAYATTMSATHGRRRRRRHLQPQFPRLCLHSHRRPLRQQLRSRLFQRRRCGQVAHRAVCLRQTHPLSSRPSRPRCRGLGRLRRGSSTTLSPSQPSTLFSSGSRSLSRA